MAFYVTLLAVNLVCFLPLYALNFRDAPNPFEFLVNTEKRTDRRGRLRMLFARMGYTDPFRVNFDFTLVVLTAAAVGYSPTWLRWGAALLLAFGFVGITYTATMRAVLKRPPAIASDISLAKAGISLAQGHRYWIMPAALALLGAIGFASYLVTELLFDLQPQSGAGPLIAAALLIPPGLYHCRSYDYTEYLTRTVYSPLLHLYGNLEYTWRLRAVSKKGASYFASRNQFKDVLLAERPNIVTICVESYGSLVYRDAQYSSAIADLLTEYEGELAGRGYRFASTFSEPPIFAGGSWLSYTSFAYGFRLADVQLFDALFNQDSDFSAYESLFHVLKRNGYSNFLVCPLGGIDARSVDWASIDRCFQSDHNLDFASLGYRGPLVNYFGVIRRYSPPDQYSLEFGYETARNSGQLPFSLFFCTLNSHMPWESPARAVPDWRTLNHPNASLGTEPRSPNKTERYRDAIRYQLDYILRFVVDHADDDLLIVIFGDHQPPFLTTELMGKQTPVHVIGRNAALMNVFRNHGFAQTLNLTGIEPPAIKHEGFMSLFLKGLNAGYGRAPSLEIPYRPDGIAMFNEA